MHTLRSFVLIGCWMIAAPLAAQTQNLFTTSFEPNEFLDLSVDPALTPRIQTQPGFNGGPDRPVALLASELAEGLAFHFIENEVYLITNDPQDLDEFQSRWPSTVLREVDLDVFDTGTTQDVLYILQVDASGADTASIRANLEGAAPGLVGRYTVSSMAALRLIALAASEISEHGLRVGINPVLETDAIAERNSTEAVNASDITSGSIVYPYDPNAFSWPFMKREDQFASSYSDPLNTGAAEAIRAVQAAGRLSNDVRVMIADAGFFPNDDYPAFDIVNGLRGSNPAGCGDGPPAPGSDCATHGTHVVLSGFGRADNGFGTLGPGGEVGDLLLLQSPSLDVSGIVNYIVDGIRAFAANPPSIINISASVNIAGGWCFLACEPLDLLVGIMRGEGILIVAAAGNDSYDVDAIDRFCFIACVEFEEAAIIPCELDGVLCVGATTSFQTFKAGYSNFGSSGGDGNSVDIYAPGDLYSVNALAADSVNPAPDDRLHIINGTSFASPFTAGVLALTMASNPSLSTTQAETCLLANAFGPFPGFARRTVNAMGAVSCAMGGSHPYVRILGPGPGDTFVRGLESLVVAADADDFEQGQALSIQWTSSQDGNLTTSTPGDAVNAPLLSMQLGAHSICARVTDSTSRSANDCVGISVETAPPFVEILQPAEGASFFESSTINLGASVSDPDGPVPPASNIRWYLYPQFTSRPATPVATGLNASLPGGSRAPGTYVLDLDVTDVDGGSRGVTNFLVIEPDPLDLPPTVTISQPVNGQTKAYDGVPVRFDIVAAATDAEDGSIPFADIDWTVSIQGGPSQPLTVQSFQFCFDPPVGPPSCGPIEYWVELEPLPGASSTQFDIKATVTDSSGQSNATGNGRVTVFVTTLI